MRLPIIIWGALLMAGCSTPPKQNEPIQMVTSSKEDIIDYYENYQPDLTSAPGNENLSIVKQEATAVGISAGRFYASNEINNFLERHKEKLDQVDFKLVMIKRKNYYIVPPVITVTNSTRALDDARRYIKINDETIRIESDPRFVVELPSWRDFLMLQPKSPRHPTDAFLPENEQERKVWKRAFNQGFKTGIKLAEQTLDNKWANLLKTFQGMQLYHVFRERNIVTAPRVEETYAPVVGGGQELVLEESTVEIVVNPRLNANRFSWRSIPRLPDISHLFPRGLHINYDADDYNGF